MTGSLEGPFESDARGVTGFATAVEYDRLGYPVYLDCDPIDGSHANFARTRTPEAD